MKVICINKVGWLLGDTNETVDGPNYEDIDLVYETIIDEDGIGYIIERFGIEDCFLASCFVIIEDAIALEEMEELELDICEI